MTAPSQRPRRRTLIALCVVAIAVLAICFWPRKIDDILNVPLGVEQAAIVSSPRLFSGLFEPLGHGDAPDDLAAAEEARRQGKFVYPIHGETYILPDRFIAPWLDSMVVRRGGSGAPGARSGTSRRCTRTATTWTSWPSISAT